MFKIEIDTDKYSSRGLPYEVAGTLGAISRKMADGSRDGIAMDLNGNGVGHWGFIEPFEAEDFTPVGAAALPVMRSLAEKLAERGGFKQHEPKIEIDISGGLVCGVRLDGKDWDAADIRDYDVDPGTHDDEISIDEDGRQYVKRGVA